LELVKDEAILQELGQWVTDLQNAEIKLGFTKAGRPLHVQCSYPIRQLLRSSLYTSLIRSCGSIFGLEGEIKEYHE